MPTLNWIGKDKVINHDKEVPFRLLTKNKKLSLGQNSENLIVEGDNLEALKAMMPFYYNKVKCIYIDPPYNTGNEKWVYNDNVNSPKIKEWLGKVVGAEGEDLTRHDKWLCMMYPRLKLLRDLLRDDGVIFVSIDDNEHCDLRMAMDEIFGEENFITTIIWSRKHGRDNSAKFFSKSHEYVVMFAKNIQSAEVYKLEMDENTEKAYRNSSNDKRGPHRLLGAWARGTQGGSKFKFVSKTGKVFSERLWLFNKANLERLDREERLVFVGDKVYRKLFRSEHTGSVPETIWQDTSNAANAADEIKDLFGSQVFDTAKPTPLLKRIFQISTKEDDIILDSFAGSGTTAQAVLELNKEDGGNRKFVLVELEKDIARKITSERVRRVSKNLKGSFDYMELDGKLFNADKTINNEVKFSDLASYIYFTETNEHADKKAMKGDFIGKSNDTEYYLVFNGSKENAIDELFLKKIKKSEAKKVVYADKCMLDSEDLLECNITFKQIPYEVKVY